ncbi:Acyl-coenzyme A thioesterase 10, mitochondrial [Chionoecetes opilio]|uniref:Acyl-coenzyme A thioesterase 10, mitochondrial n=1 Tax=Chionoecetes opilio TaxID=41210 RepID=A0A8J8WA97_CHIOP|nr:Acyl-coenzyme A thioesterase 10, mitochondrial [Chionoecetes opilio]
MSLTLLSRLLPSPHRPGCGVVRQVVSAGWLPSLSAPRTRRLHGVGGDDTPTKTVKEVICSLTSKVGATHSFSDTVDRSHLLKLLPLSQEELPARTMRDSWDSAIIPLGSEERLREKYVTFMGGVRVGRLLEDLDVFAVWLCYKHIQNPRQTPDLPSPYSIVTALVDRIDFDPGRSLHPDRDIRISGHVSWTGRSSLETILSVEQREDDAWRQVTRAVFVMVARDPLNQGSAFVNPLVCETPEERKIYQAGEVNKLHRKLVQEESLFRVPPNESEKTLVHELFMSMANPKELSFTSKKQPDNSVWMEETKLKNLIICHPEHRNRFKKVFGGFIMRLAFELGWACAYTYRNIHMKEVWLIVAGESLAFFFQSRNIFYKIFGGFLMRKAFELAWANALMYRSVQPTHCSGWPGTLAQLWKQV